MSNKLDKYQLFKVHGSSIFYHEVDCGIHCLLIQCATKEWDLITVVYFTTLMFGMQ